MFQLAIIQDIQRHGDTSGFTGNAHSTALTLEVSRLRNSYSSDMSELAEGALTACRTHC